MTTPKSQTYIFLYETVNNQSFIPNTNMIHVVISLSQFTICEGWFSIQEGQI